MTKYGFLFVINYTVSCFLSSVKKKKGRLAKEKHTTKKAEMSPTLRLAFLITTSYRLRNNCSGKRLLANRLRETVFEGEYCVNLYLGECFMKEGIVEQRQKSSRQRISDRTNRTPSQVVYKSW